MPDDKPLDSKDWVMVGVKLKKDHTPPTQAELDEWKKRIESNLVLRLIAEVERLRAFKAKMLGFRPVLLSYFENGGLFNPEMMDHEKVWDVMRDFYLAIDSAMQKTKGEG